MLSSKICPDFFMTHQLWETNPSSHSRHWKMRRPSCPTLQPSPSRKTVAVSFEEVSLVWPSTRHTVQFISWLTTLNHIQESKVIWQEAALPSRHSQSGEYIHQFTRCNRRTVCKAVMCRHITMSWHMPPLKAPLPMGNLDPYLIHCFLDPNESAPKWYIERFSRFCTAHPCAQYTDRQTDMQTMLCATSVAIGHVYNLQILPP